MPGRFHVCGTVAVSVLTSVMLYDLFPRETLAGLFLQWLVLQLFWQ